MSDVPPEIISDILSRLPVKSLLRFRCVSKPIKAMIDSPTFIKTHLRRQILKPNSDFKLVLKGHTLFSLDFTSIGSSQPEELDHPLKMPFPPTHVVGSCHGLVLISNNIDNNGVWNPSTKMFQKLPGCGPKPSKGKGGGKGIGLSQICGGFGCDCSGDDYKAVKTGQWFYFKDGSVVSETMVYSLKLGVWKKAEDCPYWIADAEEGSGLLAGGALNWFVSEYPWGPMFLLGLNLGIEKFQQVPFPENFVEPFRLNLVVLRECLCLLSSHVNVRTNAKNQVPDHVDIWMMKEYGVRQSWVKLFSVEQLDGRQQFSMLRPIAYSVSGKEVLMEMDNKKFFWYSLEKKSLKNAKIGGDLVTFESFVCLGTLVPLYGGGNGNDKKEKIEPDDKEKETGAENIDKGDDE